MINEGYFEEKKHGSPLFPFNIYPCSIPKDFPSVSLHWQQGMELIFIKKGKGLVQVGVDLVEAKEKDIFIVPPYTLHALRSLPSSNMEYENFLFDLRFLGSFDHDVCAQEYLLPLSAGKIKLPHLLRAEDLHYQKLADCLIETEHLCEQRNKGFELGVKANMMRFLFLLLHGSDSVEVDTTNDRMKHLLLMVEKQYVQPITVEMAARLCGYSTSHFMRWFKKKSGSSFTAYLNERRLMAAARMLKESNDKILTISESVGFDNLSNFNRQFKQRFGMSPSQYRSSSS